MRFAQGLACTQAGLLLHTPPLALTLHKPAALQMSICLAKTCWLRTGVTLLQVLAFAIKFKFRLPQYIKCHTQILIEVHCCGVAFSSAVGGTVRDTEWGMVGLGIILGAAFALVMGFIFHLLSEYWHKGTHDCCLLQNQLVSCANIA